MIEMIFSERLYTCELKGKLNVFDWYSKMLLGVLLASILSLQVSLPQKRISNCF